jgi:fructokinase
MTRIFTIGETTYDIVFRNGKPENGVVGGSALNTAISLGRMKITTYFISRIGNDIIGDMSLQFLLENGVLTDNITRYDGNSRLSLAFLDLQNNANYQFYKAEKPTTICFPEPFSNDIICFGSSNALNQSGRDELLGFLTKSIEEKVLIIYDPNIRSSTSEEMIEIVSKFKDNLLFTTILKGSDQDFIQLFKTADADEIFNIVSPFGVKVLLVTCGAAPVQLRTKKLSYSFCLNPITPLNTIGAGDNFTAGLVYGLINEQVNSENIHGLLEENWEKIIRYATQFASEVCLSESNYISNDFALTFQS